MADNEIPVQIKIIPPSQSETKRTLESIQSASKPGLDKLKKNINSAINFSAPMQEGLSEFKSAVNNILGEGKKLAEAQKKQSKDRANAEKASLKEIEKINKLHVQAIIEDKKRTNDALKAEDKKRAAYVKSAQQELINIHKAGASLFKQQEAAKTAAAKAEAKARTDAEKAAQGSVRKEVKKTADMYKEIGIKNPQRIKQDLKNIEKVQKDLNRQLKAGVIGFKEYNIAMREAQKRANLLEVGVSNARGAVGRFTARLASMSFELTGAVYGLTAIAGIIGGPAFFGTALLRKIEDAQFGISGILISMGQINGRALTFNEAMSASVEITDNLIESAYKYGVALDAITETFQATLAPGLAAGLNLSEIERIATIGTVAVKAIGLDSRQTVQEIRDLVAGGIQAASSTLARSLSLTDADIKRFTEAGTLFEELEKRLQGFAVVAAERYKTLSGSLDLLKLKVQSLFADTSGYDVFKNIVQDISNTIGTFDAEGKLKLNPEVLKVVQGYWELIKAIGTAIKDASLFIIDHIDLIKSMVKAWAAMKIGGAILGGVFELSKSIGSITKNIPVVSGAIQKLVAYVTGLGLAKYGGLFGYLLFGTLALADYLGIIDDIQRKLNPTEKDKENTKIAEMFQRAVDLERRAASIRKMGRWGNQDQADQLEREAEAIRNGLALIDRQNQKQALAIIQTREEAEAQENLLQAIKARVDLEGRATEFKEMADKSAKKTTPWEQYEDNIDAVRKKFAQFEKDYLEQVAAINQNPMGAEQQEQLNKLAAAYASADNEVGRYIASQQELKAEAIEKYWAETAAAIRQTAKDTLSATLATAKSNEVDQNRLDIQNALVGIWKDYDSGIDKLKKMYQASEDIEQTLVKQLKVLRDKEKVLKKSLDTPEKKAQYAAVVEGILVAESLISTEKDKQKDIQKEINDLLDESENKLTNLVDANEQLYFKLVNGADALERIGMTAADQAAYALEQSKRKTLELIDDMKLGVDGITDRFTSVFDDVLDGTKSLTESMKDMFNDLVNDIIKAFLKIQLNKLIGGISGGVLSIPGQALAGSGGIGGVSIGIRDVVSLSDIKSLFGGSSIAAGANALASSAGLQGANWVVGGSQQAQMLAAQGMGGFETGIFGGSNLGIGAAGLLGGLAAGKIFDGEYAGMGGGLGSALGYSLGAGASAAVTAGTATGLGASFGQLGAMAGPIGAIAGMLIGGALGGAIGGGRPAGYEEGILLDLSTGGITEQGYKEGDKKFSQKNRDIADQLGVYFQALNANIIAFEDVEAANTKLGIQISDRVDRMQDAVRLGGYHDYIGGGSSVEEVMAFAEQTLFDLYNVNVEFYQGLTKEGETLGAAYERVKTSLAYVTELTDFLSLSFNATGQEAEAAAASLADVFGGLQNLQTASAYYYANFYTEQEKLDYITKQNTETLANFNEEFGSAIQGKDDLRAFVEALDLTTDAGQKAFASAMQLAPAVLQLAEAFDQATDSLLADAISLGQSALSDLRSAIDAEKSSITERFNSRIEIITEKLADLAPTISSLSSLVDALDQTLKALRPSEVYGSVDRKKALNVINNALENAINTGQVPLLEDISESLQILSKDNKDDFATRTDWLLDQARTAAKVEELKEIASDQLRTAQAQYYSLEDQAVTLAAQRDREIAALEQLYTREAERLAPYIEDQTVTIVEALARIEAAINNINIQVINTASQAAKSVSSGSKPSSSAWDAVEQAVGAGLIETNKLIEDGTFGDNVSAIIGTREKRPGIVSYQTDQGISSGGVAYATLDETGGVASENYMNKQQFDTWFYNQVKIKQEQGLEVGFVANQLKAAGVTLEQFDVLRGNEIGTSRDWLEERGFETQGYATGGLASGWSIVGEKGAELVNFTNPARVYSNGDSAGLLDTSTMVAELQALREEVVNLRAETASTAQSSYKTAKILERVTPDGESLNTTAVA